MSRISDDQATRVLGRWIGAAVPKLLGEGMEGAVYEIDESRVAKVWFSGSMEASRRMAAFYDALAFPFQVPGIVRVEAVEGRVVTIERRLTGSPLSSVGRAEAYAIVVDVLAGIAAAGALPAARDLPVLGEESPLYAGGEDAGGEDFPVALARLAQRRIERFRPVLSEAVDGFEEKAAALAHRLREVDSSRRAVIHGDLFPGNILVEPTAVLDWGFLTTEGDPAFDAAVAAAIFDMYGPEARRAERDLLDRIERRMGYDHAALLVYRAAYSLITANAYDPAGRDGHFAWCAAALNRADVTRALLG